MANKRVYSKPGPNGKTLHYNSSGKFIGSSAKSFNGNVNHFDAKGKFAGKSWTAPSGAVKHFDAKGKYRGSSIDSALGGQIHFDAKGRVSGKSTEGFGNRYSTVFPEADEENTVENKVNPVYHQDSGSKASSAVGLITIGLIILDIIVFWKYVWPILIIGAFFLLFAIGNS